MDHPARPVDDEPVQAEIWAAAELLAMTAAAGGEGDGPRAMEDAYAAELDGKMREQAVDGIPGLDRLDPTDGLG